jgi:uncharacterized protein
MNIGDKLYVRMDYKVEGKETTTQDFQDHLTYLNSVAKERYFIGGGFSNANGGMIVFSADNLTEAQGIAQKDPIIERGLYRVEIYEWDLLILSENASNEYTTN